MHITEAEQYRRNQVADVERAIADSIATRTQIEAGARALYVVQIGMTPRSWDDQDEDVRAQFRQAAAHVLVAAASRTHPDIPRDRFERACRDMDHEVSIAPTKDIDLVDDMLQAACEVLDISHTGAGHWDTYQVTLTQMDAAKCAVYASRISNGWDSRAMLTAALREFGIGVAQ